MQEIGRKIRKLLGKVINRVTVTAVLLILQAVWLWVLLYVLADYAKWINPVMLGLSLVMCAALIRQDSTAPEFKISWMALFVLMPIQGGLLYLLWGDKRPAFRLRKSLERAAAGVDVRMIYDDVGCASRLPAAYWRTLEREGIRAVPFNPFVPVLNMVMNSRDHRKIVAVDGSVAFTGGFNLADEYINREQRFGHWRDTAVRLEGPGAWNFAAMFLELWASQRPRDPGLDVMAPELRPAPQRTVGLVQPYADSPVDQENVAKNVYLELINQAQSALWITTPYLILDNATLTALRLAAKRGVDVRIYVPGIPDKKMVYQLTKSFFAPLLRGGVKIFTYTPGFLHAKTWLVDGEIAAVGSINLDYRSLYLHFECSVLLYGCPALADIAADMMDIERVSHPVELSESRSGVLGTMVSAVLRLLAPLC